MWGELFSTSNAILVGVAFLTSTLSGVLGMGGGLLLFSVMANVFPPATLIPLHGAVQLASNSSRAALGFRDIRKEIFWAFAAGALLGALVGSQVVVQLPEREFKIILAVFILWMTWAPPSKAVPRLPGKFFWLGMASCFASLFVGATGPLQATFFLTENLKKEVLVVTKAATQTVQHALKILVFVFAGFSFAPHFGLLVAMVLAVVLGSYCGRLVLGRVPDKTFFWLFRLAITILALRMLVSLYL